MLVVAEHRERAGEHRERAGEHTLSVFASVWGTSRIDLPESALPERGGGTLPCP